MAKPENIHHVPREADHIERSLKHAFEKLAAEPLPERFSVLLEQLRKAELHNKDVQ